MKCFGDNLLDLDVTSGTSSTYNNLPVGHGRGNLAIDPSTGNFAYSVGDKAPFNIALLNLSNLSAAPTTIALGFGVGISFHPTGKWAYFWSDSGTRMLETGPSGTPPVSGLVSVPARSFYGNHVGGDRAYALSLTGNDYSMTIHTVDQVTGQLSQLSQPGNPVILGGDRAAPQGALIPVFPVKVNTNLDTTLLDPDVGIDNIGSATDEYTNPNVPTGQVNVTATATVVEGNKNDIEWRRNRIVSMETTLLDLDIADMDDQIAQTFHETEDGILRITQVFLKRHGEGVWDAIQRHLTSTERSYQRAMHELRLLQGDRFNRDVVVADEASEPEKAPKAPATEEITQIPERSQFRTHPIPFSSLQPTTRTGSRLQIRDENDLVA